MEPHVVSTLGRPGGALEGKPTSRWALELIVLIAGILGAFALDSWWESRAEAQQMVLELRAVSEAFEGDKQQLEFMIDTHRRVVAGLGEILAMQAAAASAGRDRVTVPDSLLFTVLLTPTFDPSLGALRVLIDSGRFALIQDRDLRQSLAGWQERLLDANEYQERNIRFGTDDVWPRILYDARHEEASGLLEVAGAYWDAFWSGVGRDAPLPSGTYELFTQDDYRTVIMIKRGTSREWLREWEPLALEMDRVIERIAAELQR